MGAWGHGSFENDSALDWLGDLQDGDDLAMVAEALDRAAEADPGEYLDADDACAALVAAELVAAAHGLGDDRLSSDAADWLGRHRAAVAKIPGSRARRAVDRVYGASELRELWDDTGSHTWHQDVQVLLTRLATTR